MAQPLRRPYASRERVAADDLRNIKTNLKRNEVSYNKFSKDEQIAIQNAPDIPTVWQNFSQAIGTLVREERREKKRKYQQEYRARKKQQN
jgi:hypothetical protein